MADRLFVNDQIRGTTVILVGEDGKNHGEVPRIKALQEALQNGLDLVQVARNEQNLPICKITDYGKMKYEASKKNKHQHKTPKCKEIMFNINIADHDLSIKKKKVREFLQHGHQVRFGIELKGRQKTFMTDAKSMLENSVNEFKDIARFDQIQINGRHVVTTLYPVHG